jgi:deazaflavin-dependent oxidoreductase (nitroreductase family)
MSEESAEMSELMASRLNWVAGHVGNYIASGGVEGHIVDFTDIGGYPFSPTLLLRTVGRKSGETRITPVNYGLIDGGLAIIASKGGSDSHPAWYLNMQGHETVDFQIATQAFRARWRELEGKDRNDVWAYMERVYKPFRDYQLGTSRQIPLIFLQPEDAIPVFTA